MKLRCPYCRNVFEALAEARCPSCGKALRMPERPPDPKAVAAKPTAKAERKAKRWRSMRNPTGRAPTQRPPALLLPLLMLAGRPRRTLLMVVLVGVLAAGMLIQKAGMDPNHPGEPHEVTRARAELGVLRTALEWFCATCDRYPTTEEGLRALVRNPGVPGWSGHYIESLYPDPWKRQYQYACSNTTVTLLSLGPDGKAHTADDLIAPTPDFKAIMERILPSK